MFTTICCLNLVSILQIIAIATTEALCIQNVALILHIHVYMQIDRDDRITNMR